jgi:hypothetical protein
MDKVDRYLDQVCRGIAGPRSLRQHIRQELAEHLRDAAGEHQAAGMSEDEALARALEDFGGPEQVRAELEATHGHRLLTVVVDKAMQWKETTMKVRWIWTTWAHVTVLLTLAMGLAFVYGIFIFIFPKFWEMRAEGWLDTVGAEGAEPVIQWSFNTLTGILSIWRWDVWIGIGLLGVWGLFEWRVRSENKTYMRLAGLGTLAVGALAASFLLSIALILPLIIAMTPSLRADRAYDLGRKQLVAVNTALESLEKTPAENDWNDATRKIISLRRAFRAVGDSGYSVWAAPEEVARQKRELVKAHDALHDAQEACLSRSKTILDNNLRSFRDAYGNLRSKPDAASP